MIYIMYMIIMIMMQTRTKSIQIKSHRYIIHWYRTDIRLIKRISSNNTFLRFISIFKNECCWN